MPFTLSNPHLHFTLDESTSTWSLFTQKSETPSIEGARFNGYFRFDELNTAHLGGMRPWQWRGWLDGADIFQRERESAHGELKTIIARVKSGIESLAITVEFALPPNYPFLLITIRVQNIGAKPFRVSRLNSLFAGPLHRTGAVRLDTESSPLTFFSNGWQSWSYAGTLNAKQTQPYTNLGIFQSPVNHNPLTPRSEFRGQFSGDMFGVLSAPHKRNAIIAGFISQREQFGSVDVIADPLNPSLRLRAQCDDVTLLPNAELITDAAYIQLIAGYDDDPLRDYAEAVARENKARVPVETPVGWCSWYHYFDKVSENDLRANLNQIDKDRARLPLTLIQLDDGFEANVGDWEANQKFPSGLRAVADSIRSSNFVPGLWLAPFIAKPDSKLARGHGDWFVGSDLAGFRNPRGLKANAGFVFNRFCRGLDTTHPAAQDFTRSLISKAVNEWGYPYLKLDFLYAAALRGKRYDSTVTRAQALRRGLEIIREAAGEETFLLGCGCPLGSSVGIVDGMRISADVAPDWKPKFLGMTLPFRDEKGMPSAENAIRNTITRAPLHRRWWLNDPDCLLVRETTNLNLDEVQALASVIALSGGMFMVSDDMTTLSEERRRIVEKVMPLGVESSKWEVGSGRLEIRNWLESEMPEHLELKMSGAIGEWKVVGLFNWSERKTKKQLNVEGESHVWDFWNQTYTRAGAETAHEVELAPHSGRLLAIRRAIHAPQFVGSSLHFSQGLEISEWDGTERSLRVVVKLNRSAEGNVYIALPKNSKYKEVAEGIYSFPINLTISQELKLEW